LIHATEKSLEELGEKVQPEERAKIESAISDLKEAVKGEDKANIEARAKTLGEASAGMAQRVYAEQAQEAKPDTPETGGDEHREDVVDAEFEEVKEEK